MNYQETLAYLDSLGKFGIRLGMERIEGLLRELGNPERKIKTIHVTGTNGKGSDYRLRRRGRGGYPQVLPEQRGF